MFTVPLTRIAAIESAGVAHGNGIAFAEAMLEKNGEKNVMNPRKRSRSGRLIKDPH